MNLRRSLILLSLIILIAFNYGQQAGANYPEPGTAADPLVTKSYLDDYLGKAFGQLKEEIAYLQVETKKLDERVRRLESRWIQPILLTIGKRQASQGHQVFDLAVAPYTKNGRTMLPFRFIGEAMGAEVQWEGAKRQATFRLGQQQVSLTIGSREAQLNGQTVVLDTPPELLGSVTMVPARFVADGLGARVDWLPEKQQVIIYP